MKRLHGLRFGVIAYIPLLIVSLLSLGTFKVATAMDHGTMPMRQGNCQQTCAPATITATTGTKTEIQEKQFKKHHHAYPTVFAQFTFSMIRQLTHEPSVDYRLLRPPDLNLLHSLYRF